MKSILMMFAFIFSSLNVWADADVQSVAPHGKIQFEAIGKPSMLKIKGEGDGATADLVTKPGSVSGVIKFDLNKLTTGIELRDNHMKEKYLQVKEKDFSIVTLTLKDLQTPPSWSVKDATAGSWTFQGTLHLHGVDKVITGSYAIGSKKLDLVARFDIKLSEFGIQIPEYLGVKVADVVNVTVSFDQLKVTEKPTSGPVKK